MMLRSLMTLHNRLKLLFSAVTLAFVAGGCGQKPEPLLRIGCNIWPGYECLFLARSLGYYEGHPIQLVEFSSNTEVIRAFQNGAIEAAALSGDELLRVAELDDDIRAVLVMNFSNGADVVLAKPGITNLADLKGRSVAVEVNAAGSFVLTRSLESVQLKPSDVRIAIASVADHFQAAERKTVDAVVTFEPSASKIKALGWQPLFDSSRIPGEIVGFLVVRKRTLDHHHRTLVSSVQGWFKAREYLQQNIRAAAERVAPREDLSADAFLETLKRIRIPDRPENLRLLSGSDPATPHAMSNLSTVMRRSGLIKSSPEPEQLFDATVSKAAIQ